jgi:hypothetical protein
MRQGRGDGLPPVGLAAGHQPRAQQAEAVGVAFLELGEGGGVVRARDDDRAQGEIVAVELGEDLDGALEDGLAPQVLVEFVADGPRLLVPLRRPGRWNDHRVAHAQG